MVSALNKCIWLVLFVVLAAAAPTPVEPGITNLPQGGHYSSSPFAVLGAGTSPFGNLADSSAGGQQSLGKSSAESSQTFATDSLRNPEETVAPVAFTTATAPPSQSANALGTGAQSDARSSELSPLTGSLTFTSVLYSSSSVSVNGVVHSSNAETASIATSSAPPPVSLSSSEVLSTDAPSSSFISSAQQTSPSSVPLSSGMVESTAAGGQFTGSSSVSSSILTNSTAPLSAATSSVLSQSTGVTVSLSSATSSESSISTSSALSTSIHSGSSFASSLTSSVTSSAVLSTALSSPSVSSLSVSSGVLSSLSLSQPSSPVSVSTSFPLSSAVLTSSPLASSTASDSTASTSSSASLTSSGSGAIESASSTLSSSAMSLPSTSTSTVNTTASGTATSLSATSVSASGTSLSTTATGSDSSPSATTGSDEIAAYLDTHNSFRAEYDASALTWSTDLQAAAQSYANSCQFANPAGALGAVGTNLAAGTGTFEAPTAVTLFMSDASSYDPEDPTFSHFTQVVWKNTTELGCASAVCDSIFDQPATYHVCVYAPTGNVVGQAQFNVQA